MSNGKPMSGALKISIATGVVHTFSAVTALTFFLIMKYATGGMEGAPFLIIFAVFLAIFAISGIFIFAIQLSSAVGITVTASLKKQRLFALFCGLPLLVDVLTVFCAVIVGFTLATSGLNGTVIFLAIDSLLLALLSLAGTILSIIAMVRNLSDKSNNVQ